MIREEEDPLETGQMVGEFQVSGMLAIGGMGVVYSALHPVIGKRAAIKVLHPRLCDDQEAVDRFIIEARAANQIGHPNIVDIFAFGVLSDGRSYMAMEWLAGESLAQRLERGPLTLEESLVVLEQASDALEAAHEKGIVHRDLKPDNIFLVPVRGRTMVKILDFGIAKLLGEEARDAVNSTRPGAIMGTPGYLAPEQARGMSVDGRTDIYALGCVMFEALTGRMPFDFDNIADMIAAHLEALPPHLRSIAPDVPRDLDSLVVRMLEKDPQLRPSLAEVRRLVRALARASGISRHAIAKPEPPPRRRNWAIAGTAAVLTAGVGFFFLFRGHTPVREPVSPESVAAPALVEPPPVAPAPAAAPAPETATLSITVDTPARITVDGLAIAENAPHAELTVKPGVHEILISAPGRQPLARYLPIEAGARVELPVELVVEPGRAPPARPSGTKHARDKKDYMLDPFAE